MENFLEFLKKKKNTVILKILKISEKSNGRFTVKKVKVSLKPFSSKKYVIEFYTQLFKDLKLMLYFERKRPLHKNCNNLLKF